MKKKIKTILVSQPKPLSDHNPYMVIEKTFNVKFEFRQLIRVVGIDAEELRQTRFAIQNFPSVIFKSRHGIDHFFRICTDLKIEIPKSQKFFCISESIAKYLQKYIQYRKRNVFIAENNSLESLISDMQKNAEDHFLMVVSDVYNKSETVIFENENLQVTPIPMYRTIPIEWPTDIPFEYYMIVFFTSTGVYSLKKNFPQWVQGDTVIACMGNSTARTLIEQGFRVDIQAPNEQCPSITQAIKQYLETHL